MDTSELPNAEGNGEIPEATKEVTEPATTAAREGETNHQAQLVEPTGHEPVQIQTNVGEQTNEDGETSKPLETMNDAVQISLGANLTGGAQGFAEIEFEVPEEDSVPIEEERPRRRAATKAKATIKGWTEELQKRI